MIERFKDVVENAREGEKSAIRALQAWQYLIGKASNRQIIRYCELSKLMEYKSARPLSSILGCIMFFCEQNNLPPLTIIVVNENGIPGEGFTAENLEDYHAKRENVFKYQWYKMIPPKVEEFRNAYTNGIHTSAG